MSEFIFSLKESKKSNRDQDVHGNKLDNHNPSYPVALSDMVADKPRLEYTYYTSLSLQNQENLKSY